MDFEFRTSLGGGVVPPFLFFSFAVMWIYKARLGLLGRSYMGWIPSGEDTAYRLWVLLGGTSRLDAGHGDVSLHIDLNFEGAFGSTAGCRYAGQARSRPRLVGTASTTIAYSFVPILPII